MNIKTFCQTKLFGILAILLQLFLFIIFIIFGDYVTSASIDSTSTFTFFISNFIALVGFAFLSNFMRKYGHSGIGFTLLIVAFAFQVSIIVMGFDFTAKSKFVFNLYLMKNSLWGVICVLITFGALLGKVTPVQLIVIIMIEIPVYAFNKHVCNTLLKVRDPAEGMYMHMFGAYFGLIIGRVYFTKPMQVSSHDNPSYFTEIVSMIGTLILWASFPVFNTTWATTVLGYNRSMINTVVGLLGSTAMVFIISNLSSRETEKGRFTPLHVAQACLSGAVAVASMSDHYIHPWGALLMGILAGTISALGFRFLTPVLNRVGFHDSRGVNNLHGLPSILGALGSAATASMATAAKYGDANEVVNIFPGLESQLNRSPSTQAGFQLAALVITLVLSMASGAITGLLLRFAPGLTYTVHGDFTESTVDVHHHHYYNDRMFWVLSDHPGSAIHRDGEDPSNKDHYTMHIQPPVNTYNNEAMD